MCITLLTTHGGYHGACCVTSYDVRDKLRAGSQDFAGRYLECVRGGGTRSVSGVLEVCPGGTRCVSGGTRSVPGGY